MQLQENPVLFDQVVDHIALVAIEPASSRGKDHLQRRKESSRDFLSVIAKVQHLERVPHRIRAYGRGIHLGPRVVDLGERVVTVIEFVIDE